MQGVPGIPLEPGGKECQAENQTVPKPPALDDKKQSGDGGEQKARIFGRRVKTGAQTGQHRISGLPRFQGAGDGPGGDHDEKRDSRFHLASSAAVDDRGCGKENQRHR